MTARTESRPADRYSAIDVHRDPSLTIWPSSIPVLTGPEAIRAARRLWRFSLGEVCPLRVVLTSGNRYSWTYRGELRVNPDRGWRHLLHDLSHMFVRRENPYERPHSKFHARFEAKLIREVIKRGWLDGSLRDKPKAEKRASGPNDQRRDKLARIEANAQRWERKAQRAQRALAKLQHQRRYYERAIAKESA